MNIVVMKFGGTSLQNEQLRDKAASLICERKSQKNIPVVVVSAMGRSGDAYATDSLLQLVEEDVSARDKDMLASCGEIIAAVVIAEKLNKKGFPAQAVNGFQAGIITDDNHGFARVKKIVLDKLLQIIKQGIIPVIAGYQGINEIGEITTLGRGGSDTTASLLAYALEADCIEIYTDVEGIYTADPRIVENAQLVKEVNYLETVEITSKGAKIIHPRAVEIAESAHIPIKIISTLSGNSGSLIKTVKMDRPVTGISSKNGIIQIEVTPRISSEYESGTKTFLLLAEKCISVDFIDIRPDSISFIISQQQLSAAEEILRDFQYQIKKGLVKVSVVGAGMTGLPGIMAKIAECLHRNNITIYECTDSQTSISCLVAQENEHKAVQALHDEFELGKK